MQNLKQQLAERGVKLHRIIHLRNLKRKIDGVSATQSLPDYALKALNMGGLIDPRGGATVVVLKNEKTGELSDAVAECHPSDSYNRKKGREIAIERAMEKFN